MRRRIREFVKPVHHVREREDGLLAHAERDVKISQTDVRVDAEHTLVLCGQAGCDPRAERRFSRSALPGDHRKDFAHAGTSQI